MSMKIISMEPKILEHIGAQSGPGEMSASAIWLVLNAAAQ